MHALITGGTSGIGLAISRAFISEGYCVSICSRSALTKDKLFTSELSQNKAQLINIDVTSKDSIQRGFNEAKKKFGEISILVNNAGQAISAPFDKSDSELFTKLISVNLMSVLHCSQLALEDMKSNQFGRIINIASTAGLIGYAYTSAYCASKHAVIGLTKSLALELAKTGITVNSICPGFTNTDIAQNAIQNIVEKTKMSFDEAKISLTKFNPMQRMIEPAEVANAALWLASAGASSITGQAISVSGGEVMSG